MLTVTNQIPTESFTGTFFQGGRFCIDVSCTGSLFSKFLYDFHRSDYSSGTTIKAGTLTVDHASGGVIDALGTATFTPNNGGAIRDAPITFDAAPGLGVPALASSVTATLGKTVVDPLGSTVINDITINPGSSARIEATPGVTFTLADNFAYDGGPTTLHFGSPTDTGTVVLAFPAAPVVDAQGQISIDGGTLQLAPGTHGPDLLNSPNLSAVTVTGGTLDLNGLSTTVTNLNLAGGTVANGTLNSPISSTGGTVDGIGGSASLTTTAGTTTLRGNDTYTGPTTIAGGTVDVVGNLGLPAIPSGPINIASRGELDVGPTGSINIGTNNLTNNGVVNEQGAISARTLFNNGVFNGLNNGVAAGTFVNNGLLDLRNPNTVATNFTIRGNYVAGDPQINLNVLGQQANHLTITGLASGATNILAIPFPGTLSLFTRPIPIINDGPGSTATFNLLASPLPFQSVVAYGLEQDPATPTQWNLTSRLNAVPIGAIAGSISSAVTSVATGFFQGTTAFLGAPAAATPNQVDYGFWSRGGTGMNTERTVATTSVVPGPTDLKTATHFSGYQVGSDAGMFNIQNSGWNLHFGVTAGEYVASTSEENFLGASSNYTVPFLGLYAAATGHNFYADVLVRHDFWQGDVSSTGVALQNVRMNGDANAVTAEAGYTYRFQNGMFVTPSVGFAYTNATFDQLSLLPGSVVPPTLNVGAVISDLGRLGLVLGDTFATPYWALTPTLNLSGWHEFAGPRSVAFRLCVPRTGCLCRQHFRDPHWHFRAVRGRPDSPAD